MDSLTTQWWNEKPTTGQKRGEAKQEERFASQTKIAVKQHNVENPVMHEWNKNEWRKKNCVENGEYAQKEMKNKFATECEKKIRSKKKHQNTRKKGFDGLTAATWKELQAEKNMHRENFVGLGWKEIIT